MPHNPQAEPHPTIDALAGKFHDKPSLVAILTGIAKGIGGKLRHYSAAEHAFYSALMTYGGPLVHKFVSQNLLGPALGTTRRKRTAGVVHFRLYDLASNVKQVGPRPFLLSARFKMKQKVRAVLFPNPRLYTLLAILVFCTHVPCPQAVKVLAEHGLGGAPCVLCEDASANQPRVDVIIRAGKLWVYGLNGGVYEVESAKALWDLIIEKGLALVRSKPCVAAHPDFIIQGLIVVAF